MKGIVPFLWFDDQAEEAANQYVAIFKDVGGGDSRITAVTRYGEHAARAANRPVGSVFTVAFQLNGQEVMALNGGPEFQFTEAISLMVNCETQDEVDQLWERLSEGGEEGPCGWLKDRYGVSWQIAPSIVGEMMQDEDRERAERVMAEVLQMKKIDIQTLQRAAERR